MGRHSEMAKGSGSAVSSELFDLALELTKAIFDDHLGHVWKNLPGHFSNHPVSKELHHPLGDLVNLFLR